MIQWVLLDFLWRVALGLGVVLGLILMVRLGIPQRKLRAIYHRLPD
jgi:hypothetical protein